MKSKILLLALGLLPLSGMSAVIRLDNLGSGTTTGSDLDEISSTPTSVNVTEIAGLQITVMAILGSDTGANLNSTSTSLGINSDNDTDTDAFEASHGQGFTFRFNQDVSITQLDFTNFGAGETLSFAGSSIGNDDLSNGTLDTYDFSTPLEISANTDITLLATSGIIGIEAMTLTTVPEPSVFFLAGFAGIAALGLRHRKE